MTAGKIVRLIKLAATVVLIAALGLSSGCSNFVSEESVVDTDAAKLYNTGGITLYRFDGGTVGMPNYDDDWYNGFLDYYQTEFGGTVTTVNVEWQGWEKRYNADLASGTAPDLIQLFEKNYVNLLKRDLLVSVEDLTKEGIVGFDHPSLFLKQDLAAQIYSSGGKTYAFACAYAEADMIFVNEDLFARKGLKSPYDYYGEGHWNMNTFTECVKAVTQDTDSDGKNDIYGFYCWDPSCFITSAGGRWVELDQKGEIVSHVDSQATLQGFQAYRNLYGGDYATNRYSNWLSGKTAMVAWLPQSEHSNIAESRLDFNWSVIPFPLSNSNDEGIRPGKCYGWAIPQSSVNRQCCVNYVIAFNAYSIVQPDPMQQLYGSAFTANQLEMLSDCTQKVDVPIYNGVGQLGTTQWDLWGALSDPTLPFDEVVDSIVKETARQIKSKATK